MSKAVRIKPPEAIAVKKSTQCAWIFIIYFFLAMANLRTKAFITPWFGGEQLLSRHAQLMRGIYPGTDKYRLLVYYIAEFFHQILRIDIFNAYILQRLLWTTITFFTFHCYLRKWFDAAVAMVGTLFLAATMQWTYYNTISESEPLTTFLFLVGLWAIRENAWGWLVRIVIVGSFTQLAVLYLPLVYFFCRYNAMRAKELLLRTALLILAIVSIYSWIRWWYGPYHGEIAAPALLANLSGIMAEIQLLPLNFIRTTYLGVCFLYGVFWVAAYAGYREKPIFLRRAGLIVPFYVGGYLLMTSWDQYPPFLPLAPLIIPMGLCTIFPDCRSTATAPSVEASHE